MCVMATLQCNKYVWLLASLTEYQLQQLRGVDQHKQEYRVPPESISARYLL